MKQNNYPLHIVLVLVGFVFLALTGCVPKVDSASLEADGDAPATIERLDGSIPTRLTLTEDAATRIDIQSVEARDVMSNNTKETAVPYGAIIYDIDGKMWLYTRPEKLIFERTSIVIDHIDGDVAFLSVGPSAGTQVVTRGVAELYGAETEFAEE